MKDTDIIKAVAEVDGWDNCIDGYGDCVRYGGTESETVINLPLPPYLTSRDAIVPVIEKCIVGVEAWVKFFDALDEAVGASHSSLRIRTYMMRFKATPRQLCEALLRAKGNWVEPKDIKIPQKHNDSPIRGRQ